MKYWRLHFLPSAYDEMWVASPLPRRLILSTKQCTVSVLIIVKSTMGADETEISQEIAVSWWGFEPLAFQSTVQFADHYTIAQPGKLTTQYQQEII